MNLRSKNYEVMAIKKKTRASFFKDLKVGDVIVLEMRLKNTTGASGGGNYASYIEVINLTQVTHVYNSQSQLLSNLDNFELEVHN